MTTTKHTRRPGIARCEDCGEVTHLVRCGVDGHGRFTTRQQRLAGACNGRVYVHAATGGMECGE